MQAVFLDYASLDQDDLDFTHLEACFDQLILHAHTDAQDVQARIADCEVVITNKVVLNADTIEKAKHLKLILISATGTNNVDLVAARERGIVVCNCQGYGTAAVAQHTLMLMLNLATSFLHYDRAVRAGQWNQSQSFCLLDFPIVELSGKTLGIVGYGELGQAVARLAEAFGMKILVAQLPNRPSQVGRVALDDLLPQVDFLSLHCPLTDTTRDLMSTAQFAQMKSTAFLINCARGRIVNESALKQALINKEIAGAATDVLSVEPPVSGNLLLDCDIPNLIITPHSAWGSVDARQRIISQMQENFEAFMKQRPLRQVN